MVQVMETSGECIGVKGARLELSKGAHSRGVSLRLAVVGLLYPSQLLWGGWDQPQRDDMHLITSRDHLNVGFKLGVLT